MNAHERSQLLHKGIGGKINAFLQQFVQDPDLLPRRSEMLEQLDELLPDKRGTDFGPVREALAKKATEIAAKAADRSARFELRGQVNELVVKTAQELDQFDRVVQVPKAEEIDAAQVAENVTAPAWRDEELEAIQAQPESLRR